MKAPLTRIALTCLSICLTLSLTTFPASTQRAFTRTLVVTVTDKNNAPIISLNASSFSIPNKRVIENIVDSKQLDTAVSVALLFDLSASMVRTNQAANRARNALAGFARLVQRSNAGNEYFLIGFNDKTRLLRDGAQDANTTIVDLNAIPHLSFRNGAAIFDAMQLAITRLSKSTFPKQVIIIVTDSIDDSSRATFNETIRLLKQTSALVYPIFLLPKGSSSPTEAESILQEYASVSGGKYGRAQETREFNDLIDQIVLELRSQYFVIVGISNKLENKCYDVKLNLLSDKSELKGLSIRSRKTLCIN
jgi:hypothetical protein